ncbi:pantoate--beta-alanine ligase [Paenibacillus swuensis]|uniref:Pantothenate synthetase n=1 Tax=Paenibacillus swuensis TaxID=1178515 RepID=A0A172TLM9_9BACL|nr:pantoate--beta-alanine ligase [Paenibacillus swuensis]ANE47938.1 pantoate--beta-alanine ligase [Paenibacillus swuensis]
MIVNYTIKQIRDTISTFRKRNPEGTVGFVPTMGYLHEGHASLLRKARQECDVVVLSIFVNPLQFGPTEDLDKYPRDRERDLALAEQAGTDFVFMPSVEEMYPRPMRTQVEVSGITDVLCGASRPGHFAGVATVVSKLFNIVNPHRAYFGEKDAQQVAVIEQMVADLNLPVAIVPCPILREGDGLAMSSRNVYLSPEERGEALSLSKALSRLRVWRVNEELTFGELRHKMKDEIQKSPLGNVDYIEILTYPGLLPIAQDFTVHDADFDYIVALAVKYGATRLIDNAIVRQPLGEV